MARPKLSEILLVSLLVGVAALTSATLSSKDSVAKEATKLKRQ